MTFAYIQTFIYVQTACMYVHMRNSSILDTWYLWHRYLVYFLCICDICVYIYIYITYMTCKVYSTYDTYFGWYLLCISMSYYAYRYICCTYMWYIMWYDKLQYSPQHIFMPLYAIYICIYIYTHSIIGVSITSFF